MTLFAAVDRLREIRGRVCLLRGWRIRDWRPGIHFLRDAHQCRVSGAQRFRGPRKRA